MIHQTFSLKILKKINQLATHAKLGGRFVFLKSASWAAACLADKINFYPWPETCF